MPATKQELQVSMGECPAPLVLKNGIVLNVFTGEFEPRDIAVCGERIVGIGEYEGEEEIDLRGRTVVPGFIDAHMHVESSMLTPRGLAREVLPFGTTALIADPHEIANVSGVEGLEYFLAQAQGLPVQFFLMLPSCVPATPFETSGSILDARELVRFKGREGVLGLGEMMNCAGVVSADRRVMEKLEAFCGCMVDGHAPMLSGPALQAYCCAGIRTDHESVSMEEALEKLRAGLVLLAREGSAAKNQHEVLKAALATGAWGRFCFCTDDKHIEDIRRDGHISHNIRLAIAQGVPPAKAYQMASYNPASVYGLSGRGAVAPGYRADLVVLDDVDRVSIHSVYVGGRPAKTLLQQKMPVLPVPNRLTDTVKIPKLDAEMLKVTLSQNPAPVIGIQPGQINTCFLREEVPQKDGVFIPDRVYQKLAVMERHHGSGAVGLGIVRGFNLHGAIATTVAHDSHNLLLLGDNDEDMLLAARALIDCGGGYALAQDGRVRGVLELPICGLITDQEASQVGETVAKLTEMVREMGVPEGIEPFITLSFLALPVLPELRVTDKGLFDARQYHFITL